MRTLIHTTFLALVFMQTSAPCAADDPLRTLPDADASYIRQHLPDVVVAPIKTVDPVTDADDWLPMDAVQFEYHHPGSEEKTFAMSVVPTRRAPGSPIKSTGGGWSMRLPNGTTRYLLQTEGTGIGAPTDVSIANGFIIRLDPPEPIVQEHHEVTKPLIREITVEIYDLHKPKDRAYSGKVRCTWTDLGGFRVKVPKGSFDTRLIRIEYDGSVGPASVKAKRYIFFAKDVGPVAFTDMRDISVFILFNQDRAQAGVLKGMTPIKTG